MGQSTRSSPIPSIPRSLLAIFIVLIVVVVGVVGYMLIEGWAFPEALYLIVTAIFTVTTGSGEVQPFTPAGRLFTAALVVVGAGPVLYSMVAILAYLIDIEGQFAARREEGRMRSRINRLRNHFVICGYGSVGHEIARVFQAEGVPFVVVESAPQGVAEAQRMDFPVVEGDATNDEVLQAAGLRRARGLVAVASNDIDNTYITLSAREARPNLLIISRADSPASEAKLRRAGANRVISPHAIGGRQMAMLAVRPGVVDFLDTLFFDLDVPIMLEEMVVDDKSPLAGLTVEEGGRSRHGVTILAVRKENGTIIMNPPKDTRIEAGDRLMLFGTQEQLRVVEKGK